MNKTVLISLPIEDLQTVIIDCVNSCLKNNKQESKPPTAQPEQLLTIDEVAELLHLTKPTIYSKVSKNEGYDIIFCGFMFFTDMYAVFDVSA